MKRRKVATLLVAVVGVALFACVSGVATGAEKAPASHGTVIFYGDSLTNQSRFEIEARMAALRPGWRVVIQAQGGSAICDWLKFMRADASLNPQIVVMQFSGNIQTPCIRARIAADGTSWARSYGDDAATAAHMWVDRGASVVIVGNPMAYTAPTLTRGPHPLDAVYRYLALASKNVTFSTLPERSVAVADPVNQEKIVFPFTMPCLPDELSRSACQDGQIQVRDPAGGHFCPVFYPDGQACPDYSSGIVRFGNAVADAAITRIAP